MRSPTAAQTSLLGTLMLAALPASGSTPIAIPYSSSLAGAGNEQRIAFSIRGIGDIDDISATFLDADNDNLADGFVVQTLIQGVPQGTQTRSFMGVQAGGANLLGFPIVSSSNFTLNASSFLPGVPAGALPLVPMTNQGTIVVTRMNGTPILSIPLMIDAELLSNTLFRNGFETPAAGSHP